MGKLAVDRFLALVERCGLVDHDRLAQAVTRWKAEATAAQLDDAANCGQFLIRSGLLTAWQCHKLLEGRHRGFMLGGYKLLDHLGSGGMSNVYLAEHVLMQRLVAIKVLPENRVADASYLARFQFEGQAVAALDHPNIVRAYDLGNQGRIHYLVMEYVEGHDLENLVDRVGPLPYHAAARYIAQAAAGLEHAHANGLVHRDIKPANLLVDRHGTVKVLDMGLARFKAEVRPVPDFARDEQILGTAEYFAPEQAVNSQTVDGRADIYGLGCTFYFLLTAHPPFSGRTPLELMTAHHQQSPTSIRVDRPDAPPPLVAICERMMEKSPQKRFQSCREVADALDRWLASERRAGRGLSDVSGPARAWKTPATRDTDPNLRLAATMDTEVAGSPATSSDVLAPPRERSQDARRPLDSDVLAVPPPAPTPPLVSPPRAARSGPVPSVTPLSQAASEASRPSSRGSDVVRAAKGFETSSRRAHRDSAATGWLLTVLFSALVLGALVLAIFALAD